MFPFIPVLIAVATGVAAVEIIDRVTDDDAAPGVADFSFEPRDMVAGGRSEVRTAATVDACSGPIIGGARVWPWQRRGGAQQGF